MRIVALEEHYTVPRIVSGIPSDVIVHRGFPGPDVVWSQTIKRDELAELGEARLADMDQSGISVQVLSVAGPGADLVAAQQGVAMACAYNDALAEVCTRHPNRYRGFAHLPMLAPQQAADELERAVRQLDFCGALVNGATDGRFLDDAAFEPKLRVPKRSTCRSTCTPAYRSPLCATPTMTDCLATSAFHSRSRPGAGTTIPRSMFCVSRSAARWTDIQSSRLSSVTWARRCRSCWTASTKPRQQRLKCVCASVRETILDQVWITTSGFFTLPPFMAALLSFGIDRIISRSIIRSHRTPAPAPF